MARRSLLHKPKGILVDKAVHSHDCQGNSKHRLTPGARRLKAPRDRGHEHYCVECALAIIHDDIERLQALARELQAISGG